MHFAQRHVPKVNEIWLVLRGHPKELQTIKELKEGDWKLIVRKFLWVRNLLGPFVSLTSATLKGEQHHFHQTEIQTASQREQVIRRRLVKDESLLKFIF